MAAKAPSRSASIRGLITDASRISSMVRTFDTGCCGSAARTTARTPPASVAGGTDVRSTKDMKFHDSRSCA